MTLRELRQNAGLTQADVEKKFDVNQSAVSYWESGKTKPCKKHRVKLEKLYGCTEEQILTAIEETARKNRKD